MGIGDEVRKLEEENKALRDIVNDITLIQESMQVLTQVVADVMKKLSNIDDGSIYTDEIVVIDTDDTGQTPPGPQTDPRYKVTEIGGDDEQPASTYKVDTSQYLPGGDF